MPGEQAQLQRCEIIALEQPTAAPTQPAVGPPITGGSDPHYVMSPRTPTDLPSRGFMFFFEGGDTVLVNVWIRDPTNRRWALRVTIPALTPDTWMTVCNVNASELYWQFGSPEIGGGTILLHVVEIGG